MGNGRIIAFGGAAVAVTAMLANWSLSGDIQQDVRDRVSAVLDETGASWAKFDTNGRDVKLTGRAPDETTRAEITAIVHDVWGVRSVTSKATLVPVATPFIWKVAKPAPQISLSGAVPSAPIRSEIAAEAQRILGNNVQDRSDLSRGAPGGPWENAARIGLAQVAMLNHGEAVLNDTQLVLTGQAPSAAVAFEIRRALARGMPKGFTSRAEITTPRPRPIEQLGSLPQCQAALDKAAANSRIWFQADAPFLEVDAYRHLDAAALTARQCDAYSIQITGTSNEAGDVKRDHTIGRIQAMTVRDYLVAAGTRESSITAVGRSAVDTAQSGDVGSAILRRGITFTVRTKDGS